MTPSTTCPYCGSRAIEPFCRRPQVTVLHGAYDFCTSCGVYFANPMAGDADLEEYYGTYYKSAGGRSNDSTRAAQYDWFRRTFLKRIQSVSPSGRYLEIGCGEGASLAAARDAGYEVTGIDLAANAIRFAQEKYSLDARCVRLEDLREPDGAFDVVYTYHTIEHVTDLRSFLDHASRLLKPGGWLFVGTENPEALYHVSYAWLHRLAGRPVPLNSSSSEHTFLLSPRFVRAQFPAFGLRPARVRAYEVWPWVRNRISAHRASRMLMKGLVWGTLSGIAHVVNSGALLFAESQKTPQR
jgi:SAM-dependent methyltransferase